MLMNDMHQRSYLLSFEISWFETKEDVIFQYFSEWGFSMWFKIYWNTFFAKCSCVVLVCLIPAPILFAMKQKKVRFFVYLGNRQIPYLFFRTSPDIIGYRARTKWSQWCTLIVLSTRRSTIDVRKKSDLSRKNRTTQPQPVMPLN